MVQFLITVQKMFKKLIFFKLVRVASFKYGQALYSRGGKSLYRHFRLRLLKYLLQQFAVKSLIQYK